jgi:hypothetical protein
MALCFDGNGIGDFIVQALMRLTENQQMIDK